MEPGTSGLHAVDVKPEERNERKYIEMADPLEDPDNRYHAATIEEVDAKLDDDGWATGMDVLGQVEKAYVWYLDGDGELADAQIASLLNALRRSPEPS